VTNGMVPRGTTTGAGTEADGGEEPAEGAESGPEVGDDVEVVAPGGGLGRVRDEQRPGPERGRHLVDQAARGCAGRPTSSSPFGRPP